MRVRRTGASASRPRSPLTRRPLGGSLRLRKCDETSISRGHSTSGDCVARAPLANPFRSASDGHGRGHPNVGELGRVPRGRWSGANALAQCAENGLTMRRGDGRDSQQVGGGSAALNLRPPKMRVQRTGSSASPPRSPLTRYRLSGRKAETRNDRSGQPGWVLFDDRCGFCRRWVPFWENTLKARGYRIAPLQSPWVGRALAFPDDVVAEDLRLLLPEGGSLAGADVYRYLMRRIWWAYPLYVLSAAPVLRNLFDWGYRTFAANRYRFSTACRLSGNPSALQPGAENTGPPGSDAIQ